jgi:LysR family nitrogen assimilation transcriptional regulator
MDVKQLRYFVQIAESGSLSKAAERLRLAQPALSQALRNMEEELGVQLVTRHARGVVPNEMGNLLLGHARSILREISHAQQVLQHRARYPQGEVILGLPTSVARGLTPTLIRAVRERYPEISLHIIESMSGYLSEWLLLGHLDMAILYNPKLLHIADSIRVQPFMVEELDLICPATKKYRGLKAVRLADIKNYPLVQMARPHVIRVVIETAAQKHGVPVKFVLDVDSMPGIMALVSEGYFTVFPKFAVRKELLNGELCAVPIVEPRLSWGVFIATAERGLRSRAVTLVHDLLLTVIRDMVGSGVWPAKLLGTGTSPSSSRPPRRAGGRARSGTKTSLTTASLMPVAPLP